MRSLAVLVLVAAAVPQRRFLAGLNILFHYCFNTQSGAEQIRIVFLLWTSPLFLYIIYV